MSKHSWASRPTANTLPRVMATGKKPSQPAAAVTVDLLAREDDKCPVCTKERYMNPNLRLLVSTCFHRSCTDCVQRIFGQGKAVCPIPGCGRTLYKRDWASQTFEDLTVEKEIGVRKQLGRMWGLDACPRPRDWI